MKPAHVCMFHVGTTEYNFYFILCGITIIRSKLSLNLSKIFLFFDVQFLREPTFVSTFLQWEFFLELKGPEETYLPRTK